MINYIKIIKQVNKLEIEKERKNKFLKDAILTEICNVPIEMLKLPATAIILFCKFLIMIFELIEKGLEIVLDLLCTPAFAWSDFVELKIPKFYFGDRKEHQEIIAMFKRKYN